MQTQPIKNSDVTLPNKHDSSLAEKSSRLLASYAQSTKAPSFQFVSPDGRVNKINIPASALKLLVDILVQMAEGSAVTLLPIHAELTTQEAADLLNVSRPYLVKLLNEKKIPFRKVGTRHRVLAEDVLKYKENIDKERLKTLEKLAKQAQDYNMGYE